MLQNSSVLSVIPTKRHGEIYREMFPGWCKPACACFSFLSKSKEGSLAFYSCQSLLKSNIPESHREPGASVQIWVAERGNRMHKTSPAKQGEGYCERYFRVCWFVPVLLLTSGTTGSARFLLSSSDTNFLYIQ